MEYRVQQPQTAVIYNNHEQQRYCEHVHQQDPTTAAVGFYYHHPHPHQCNVTAGYGGFVQNASSAHTAMYVGPHLACVGHGRWDSSKSSSCFCTFVAACKVKN